MIAVVKGEIVHVYEKADGRRVFYLMQKNGGPPRLVELIEREAGSVRWSLGEEVEAEVTVTPAKKGGFLVWIRSPLTRS